MRHAGAVALLGLAANLAFAAGPATRPVTTYPDGRPSASLRMEARDAGVVLRHGDGPERCDELGARDVWVYEAGGKYYMHYDAAGPKGWLCLPGDQRGPRRTGRRRGRCWTSGKPAEEAIRPRRPTA